MTEQTEGLKPLDLLQDVLDRIADEGDRAYLGSTNDVDLIKRVVAMLTHPARPAPLPRSEPVRDPYKLRAAMIEACDLLAERTHGNAARSPGHNARLRLESALQAAPLPRVEAEGWQPIESAPKDGTPFLAYDAESGGAMYRAQWELDGYFSAACAQPVVVSPKPTHWMPLPPSPEASDQRSQPQGVREAVLDEFVTALYRRFKDWSKRGFGPDDVTWCEVKADVERLIAALTGEGVSPETTGFAQVLHETRPAQATGKWPWEDATAPLGDGKGER